MKEVNARIEVQPLTDEELHMVFGQRKDRPLPMNIAVPVYEYESSKYPDKIRVSFLDGHTEVYEKRIEQPHPLVLRNIEIMKETKKKIGYVNRPERRWRKK